MARLTVKGVGALSKRGFHADGGGLYLAIAKGGSKSWVLRYQRNGKRHDLGLGSVALFTLAEARQRAHEARKLLADGVDPLQTKRASSAAAAARTAKLKTFEEVAGEYIEAHRDGWRSPKSEAAWQGTLAAYVYPVFGQVPVDQVDTGLIVNALRPIWTTKTETAGRVRGRIESILNFAATSGYRPPGDNPARWRGHLENVLADRSKVRKVEHHAAADYRELPAFLVELRKQGGIGAAALEFAILTAARTGEVLGARWSEFNLAERVWIVPADRMKAGREHKVPLSNPAVAVIERMAAIRSGDLVFPGQRIGRPLSNMALLMLLRRMGRGDLTSHGFRSTFAQWTAERTNFAHEIREMALAHQVGSAVERAYQRSDLFERRRALMTEWARFCVTSDVTAPGAVVPIRASEGPQIGSFNSRLPNRDHKN